MIRDLLAIDIDVAAMLPADDVSYGFDNIAGVQRMSPTLMERYLSAARKISSVAVGATAIDPVTETYNIPPELRQDDRLDGLPFGTRGGAVLRHTFPRDGEYGIRVQLTRNAGAIDEVPTYDQRQRLELSIDGEPIHVFELTPEAPQSGRATARAENRRALDADWMVKFQAKAGPRDVTLTFLNRTPALLENLLEPFEKPVPGGPNGYYPTQKGAYLRNVEIIGPFTITEPGDTPSRRRIFVCQPAKAADEAACSKRIISTMARRAFRRPVTDADIQTLLAFYREGREEGSFETGIERAVEGLLVSPEFLFRVQRDPQTATGRRALSHQQPGSGVASVVLPLEQHPGRSAARPRDLRQTSTAGRARAAGPPHAGRPARRRAGDQLRGTVAVPAEFARASFRIRRRTRTSTRGCAQGSAARRNCWRAAFSAKTGACWIC